jgi:hypothetical protein
LYKFKNVAAQLPTGGGKTVEFCNLAHRYYQKTNKKVLILVHREELMYQTKATMEAIFGESMSVIKAGTKYLKFTPVYIGMVESVYKRIEFMPDDIGLVIIDEAHNAAFNKLHRHFTEQMIIGFTATPKSSSKKEPMNKYYSAIAVGPQIKTLIRLGSLSQNITRSPKEVVDKTRLAIASTGDYDIGIMADEFMKTRYIMSTVMAYKEFSAGKKCIIFNVNVAHSKELTQNFNWCFENAKHVDGETPQAERDEIFKWFKTTPGAILCNVGVATMGFDEPTIETVIVNRATTSMPLWLQMCGRGSRPIDEAFIKEKQIQYPYPLQLKNKFQIIDMGGNCITHGDWSDDRDWNYIFENPDRPTEGGLAPMKECPQCGCFVHAATVLCKSFLPEKNDICGYIFNRKKYEEEKVFEEFVVVTEDPAVEELLKNIKRGSYREFFEAALLMIDVASEKMELTQTKKNSLFDLYFSFVEKWHKQAFPERYFNKEWYRTLAKYNFEKYYNFKFTPKLANEFA